jgi:hypothetical protein
MTAEFQLVYYGGFDWGDVERMTLGELNFFARQLSEVKQAEKQAHSESAGAAARMRRR